MHADNIGLRQALQSNKPLIYFHGIVPSRYLSVWPVYVIGDSPSDLAFHVAFEPGVAVGVPELGLLVGDARRTYALRLIKQRLHQVGFRERVLAAYRHTCSVCRLRHDELLDAAHIIRDGHPRGDPIVPNGLALCKLHHAAFDANIIGIRPDLVIEVRRDVLNEADGPMLLHGLQGVHSSSIWTPHSAPLRPASERLEERYEEFRRAS
jgi:putative restriction endonuclease